VHVGGGLRGGGGQGPGPPADAALPAGGVEAGPGAFGEQVALERCEGGEHPQDETPVGAGGVDLLVEGDQGATYTFTATAGDDDGVRVYLDDQPVIDAWDKMPRAVGADRPAAYWRLGEAAGTTAADTGPKDTGGATYPGTATAVTWGQAPGLQRDPDTAAGFSAASSSRVAVSNLDRGPAGRARIRAGLGPPVVDGGARLDGSHRPAAGVVLGARPRGRGSGGRAGPRSQHSAPGGRTTTSVYAVDPDGAGPANPDPLTSSVSDSAGTITTKVDLLGRVVSYTDTLGTVTTTDYNTVGLVLKTTSTPAGFPARAQEYTYDAAGRVATERASTLSMATVAYTTAGELDTVTYPAFNASLAIGGRDSAGRVTQQTWTTPAGSHVDARVLSRAGRATGSTWTAPTGQVSAKSYGYDTAGRLTTTQVSRSTTGSGTVAHAYPYGYGSADASCSAVSGSVGNAGANGNRTTVSDTVAGSTTGQVLCYDTADRLLKAAGGPWGAGMSPAYDDDGNTLALGGQSFTWDSAGRSVTAKSGSTTLGWGRDAQDRVVSRTTGVTTSQYSYTDSSVAPGWILGGGQPWFQVGLPGGAMAQLVGTTTTRTLAVPDLHGDVILTLDSTGAAASSLAVYDPDGQPLSPATGLLDSDATPDTSFGSSDNAFVGQWQKQYEHAGDLALIQMGARPYLPSLARFLAVDPVEGGTSNDYAYPEDSMNTYDLDGLKTAGNWGAASRRGPYRARISTTRAGVIVYCRVVDRLGIPSAGAAWVAARYASGVASRAVPVVGQLMAAQQVFCWIVTW
jgi:RHS repeat-associated protein